MTEEDNNATTADAKEEEELLRNDLERRMESSASGLERWMEDAMEAAKISERGMKKASKEANVKSAATKATAFLLFLVRVRT